MQRSSILDVQPGSQYSRLKFTMRLHNKVKQIILMFLLLILNEGFRKLKYIDELTTLLLKYISRKRFYFK